MIVNGKNAGYALRDEIFDWQDKLDDLEYSEEGLTELYLLIEDILDTLESRLDLSEEFIEEMKAMHQDIESGDMSDFVKVELPEKSFFDIVNDYVNAKKIGEVITASNLLIYYVKNKISDVDVEIQDNKLYIKAKNNISLSTSIISELLDIKANNIDDTYDDFNNIWSIHLHKR